MAHDGYARVSLDVAHERAGAARDDQVDHIVQRQQLVDRLARLHQPNQARRQLRLQRLGDRLQRKSRSATAVTRQCQHTQTRRVRPSRLYLVQRAVGVDGLLAALDEEAVAAAERQRSHLRQRIRP